MWISQLSPVKSGLGYLPAHYVEYCRFLNLVTTTPAIFFSLIILGCFLSMLYLYWHDWLLGSIPKERCTGNWNNTTVLGISYFKNCSTGGLYNILLLYVLPSSGNIMHKFLTMGTDDTRLRCAFCSFSCIHALNIHVASSALK